MIDLMWIYIYHGPYDLSVGFLLMLDISSALLKWTEIFNEKNTHDSLENIVSFSKEMNALSNKSRDVCYLSFSFDGAWEKRELWFSLRKQIFLSNEVDAKIFLEHAINLEYKIILDEYCRNIGQQLSEIRSKNLWSQYYRNILILIENTKLFDNLSADIKKNIVPFMESIFQNVQHSETHERIVVLFCILNDHFINVTHCINVSILKTLAVVCAETYQTCYSKVPASQAIEYFAKMAIGRCYWQLPSKSQLESALLRSGLTQHEYYSYLLAISNASSKYSKRCLITLPIATEKTVNVFKKISTQSSSSDHTIEPTMSQTAWMVTYSINQGDIQFLKAIRGNIFGDQKYLDLINILSNMLQYSSDGFHKKVLMSAFHALPFTEFKRFICKGIKKDNIFSIIQSLTETSVFDDIELRRAIMYGLYAEKPELIATLCNDFLKMNHIDASTQNGVQRFCNMIEHFWQDITLVRSSLPDLGTLYGFILKILKIALNDAELSCLFHQFCHIGALSDEISLVDFITVNTTQISLVQGHIGKNLCLDIHNWIIREIKIQDHNDFPIVWKQTLLRSMYFVNCFDLKLNKAGSPVRYCSATDLLCEAHDEITFHDLFQCTIQWFYELAVQGLEYDISLDVLFVFELLAKRNAISLDLYFKMLDTFSCITADANYIVGFLAVTEDLRHDLLMKAIVETPFPYFQELLQDNKKVILKYLSNLTPYQIPGCSHEPTLFDNTACPPEVRDELFEKNTLFLSYLSEYILCTNSQALYEKMYAQYQDEFKKAYDFVAAKIIQSATFSHQSGYVMRTPLYYRLAKVFLKQFENELASAIDNQLLFNCLAEHVDKGAFAFAIYRMSFPEIQVQFWTSLPQKIMVHVATNITNKADFINWECHIAHLTGIAVSDLQKAIIFDAIENYNTSFFEKIILYQILPVKFLTSLINQELKSFHLPFLSNDLGKMQKSVFLLSILQMIAVTDFNKLMEKSFIRNVEGLKNAIVIAYIMQEASVLDAAIRILYRIDGRPPILYKEFLATVEKNIAKHISKIYCSSHSYDEKQTIIEQYIHTQSIFVEVATKVCKESLSISDFVDQNRTHAELLFSCGREDAAITMYEPDAPIILNAKAPTNVLVFSEKNLHRYADVSHANTNSRMEKWTSQK